MHLHTHDILSNGGYLECVSTIDDYISIAKERGLPAVCISNHGNVTDWVKRKKAIEGAGLKYIHAIEAYVTDNSEEKVRNNYHLLLIAKNWEGVKEINKLSSRSYNREDNHYYYSPRMYFEEIKNTSDNIIITTACLGSPFYQHYKNGNKEELKKWLDFIIENKHRVYLEVQPHNTEEQAVYNRFLIDVASENGMKLVATNDAHASSEEHDKLRKILKKAKKLDYETDDDFELWAKSRDEMVDAFIKQGVLSVDEIYTALDNTMEIVNQIEEFDLDKTNKYPNMFDAETQTVGMIDVSGYRPNPFVDSKDIFKQLIVMGYKDRGIDKLPPKQQKKYKERVNHELATYIETGSIDYMLLEWSVKKDARELRVNPNKAIYPAYGRGSASGSLVAYLLRITEMDSIKENLNFERFMNKHRISLADIDSDWSAEDRYSIMAYLLTHPKLHCASIITKNTYALKGSIKAIGRGLGRYTPSELDFITKSIDEKTDEIPPSLYEQHKELFDLATAVQGTVDSFGRHACGIVVSSEPIDETIGTMTLPKWDYPVTQISMKELDMLNFTKLDVLSLDNLELIHEAGKMAGLGILTPDSEVIDFQDENVWMSMRDSNIGIFQFESDRAGKILKDILSPETIEKVKERNPDFRYIDLLSLANSAQRPSGASYIESVVAGEFKDNGHEALNKFLASTMGELVYQEQQTAFLVEFCGWTVGQADLIRRGIGKKDHAIMETEVPKIKTAFISTMIEKHGDTEEHANEIADSFIQVFMDSVNYGFSINHSQSYSYLGYIATWLRYYYPLEFVASALKVWSKGDKNNDVVKFAESHGIVIKPPKFRKSKGSYFIDRDEKAVYEGTSHIKGANESAGEALHTLKDYQYKTFTDLIIDVIENARITRFDMEDRSEMFDMAIQDFYRTHGEDRIKEFDKKIKANPDFITYDSSPIGVKKNVIDGLIRLNFFEEFGQNKKLQQVYDYVMANYNPKNKTFANKQKKYLACLEYEASLEDERFSILEQCEFELFYTGRVITKSETIPAKYAFVTKIDNVGKTRTTADVFIINKGISTQIKVGSKLYKNVTFEVGDLIEVLEKEVKPKEGYVGGVWTKSPTERELWIKQMKMIRRSKMTDGKKEKK